MLQFAVGGLDGNKQKGRFAHYRLDYNLAHNSVTAERDWLARKVGRRVAERIYFALNMD